MSRHATMTDARTVAGPAIGITEPHRAALGRMLNTLLADEFVLYAKTRNYHWNVTGPDFPQLHKLFEAQYEELDGIVDQVAERCRALGERALGSLREFAKAARLKEGPEARPDAPGMIADLVRDYEALIRAVRVDAEEAAKLGDAGTNDLLIGILEKHEKTAWMLRSCLEK